MRRCVVDMESNGLLDDVTKIWCIVAKDIGTGLIHYFRPDDINLGLEFLLQQDVLIMHNGIGYDLPVFRKLHTFEYSGELIDTLVVSRLQWPDSPIPKGYMGKAPHSVEAWGHRLGFHKPEHDDWTQFSNEMMHRCKEDVLGTEKIYYALLEERKR